MVKKAKDKTVEELQDFLKAGGNFLTIQDGDSAIVYFTEDLPDIPKAWRHTKRVQYQGKWYEFTCLGEGCPLCEHPDESIRRKSRRGRFVMVLEDGSIVWRDFGVNFMQSLLAVYEEEGTILESPFKISRAGKGLQTKWSIVPVKESKYPKPKGVKPSEIKEAIENSHEQYEKCERSEILDVLQKGYVTKGATTEVEEVEEDLFESLGEFGKTEEKEEEDW